MYRYDYELSKLHQSPLKSKVVSHSIVFDFRVSNADVTKDR